MSTTAKVFIAILFVLSIVYMAFSAAAYSRKADWREKYERLYSQYEDGLVKWGQDRRKYEELIDRSHERESDLQSQNMNLSGESERLKADKTALSGQLTAAQATIVAHDGLIQAQVAALASKDQLIKDLNNEKGDLDAELDVALTEKTRYQSDAVNWSTKYRGEKSKVNKLELDNRKILLDYQEAQEVIDILNGKGIDVDELIKGAAPAMTARVLAVDAELNLVMFSRGSDDNVKIGYHFYIHRRGEYVGEVVIDKVEMDASFGRIVPSGTPAGKQVQVGDSASTQLGG